MTLFWLSFAGEGACVVEGKDAPSAIAAAAALGFTSDNILPVEIHPDDEHHTPPHMRNRLMCKWAMQLY